MDHVAKALSRIIWQYRNSTKLKQWVSILPEIAQDKIELPAQKIIDIFDLDNIEGELLNIVGRIVGQKRNDPILLDDDTYRIVVKAKAFKNASDGTIDSIKRASEIITGATVYQVLDGQDMTFQVIFHGHLSDLVRSLVLTFDLIPRPQGVKLNGILEGPPQGPIFGFSEPGLPTPSFIAGFAEYLENGLYLLELNNGDIVELYNGDLLGLGDNDTPATADGGYFMELIEV